MLKLPPLPFWMHQRQLKADPMDDSTLRLSGPNLQTYEIALVPVSVGPGWRVIITRIGSEVERTTVMQTEISFTAQDAAWQSAFELYRQHVII